MGSTRARRPARVRSAGDAASVGAVGLAAAAALAYGWQRRGQLDLIAEEGLGYALGVVGLAMMSLLLVYSLRKRWRPLRSVGSAPLWLKIHMMLGILGPTAILYHANFRLGSLNSRMALFCMLVVSGSGIVGRFLYTRIHRGYLEQRQALAELKREVSQGSSELAAAIERAPSLRQILSGFEHSALAGSGRPLAWLVLGLRARRARARALRCYRGALRRGRVRNATPSVGALRRALRRHLTAVCNVARFSAYSRAFSLWHALHLPFCVVLFAAAFVHVVAVHMY
jgi:hypothetical protein